MPDKAGSRVYQDRKGHRDDALHIALREELVGKARRVRLAHSRATCAGEDDRDLEHVDDFCNIISRHGRVIGALCLEDKSVAVCIGRLGLTEAVVGAMAVEMEDVIEAGFNLLKLLNKGRESSRTDEVKAEGQVVVANAVHDGETFDTERDVLFADTVASG